MPRIVCPACGSYNEETALFCDQCGTALRAPHKTSAERRVGWGFVALIAFCVVLVVLFEGFLRKSHKSLPKRQERIAERIAPNKRLIEAARLAVRQKRLEPAPVMTAEPAEEPEVRPAGPTGGVWPPASSAGSPFAEITAVGADGRRRFSSLAVVLEGGLLLCPIEAAAGAREVGVTFAGRRFTVRSLVSWDLERGWCLLEPLQGVDISGAYAVAAEAFPGQQAFLLDQAEKAHPVVLSRPPVEDLPLVAVASSKELGGVFLLGSDPAAERGITTVLGVAWYRLPKQKSQLFGTVGAPVAGEAVDLSSWNEEIWKSSAYKLLVEGRDAVVAGELGRGCRLLAEAVRLKSALGPLVRELRIDAYLSWAGTFAATGDHQQAVQVLSSGVAALPDSVILLLALSREEATIGDFVDAIEYAKRAFALEPALFEQRPELLEDLYLRYAAASEPQKAITILNEASGVLPDSINVQVELGRLFFAQEDFAGAVQRWEEAYRLSKDPRIARLIEEARRRLQAAQQVVSIPLPESGGTIRAEVTVAGRLAVPCIIDTGATYSALPSWCVEELGLGSDGQRRISIATASGVRTVPLVTVPSISLGPLTVGPLDVLVLDLPHAPGSSSPGLLGLDFLRHFNVSIDCSRGELRIEPK